MLVTTLYGQSALQVHVQHRPVADRHEEKASAKDPVTLPFGTTCHNAARAAAVHSPTRVTPEQVTSLSPTIRSRTAIPMGQ
jgi:hypothetical protein